MVLAVHRCCYSSKRYSVCKFLQKQQNAKRKNSKKKSRTDRKIDRKLCDHGMNIFIYWTDCHVFSVPYSICSTYNFTFHLLQCWKNEKRKNKTQIEERLTVFYDRKKEEKQQFIDVRVLNRSQIETSKLFIILQVIWNRKCAYKYRTTNYCHWLIYLKQWIGALKWKNKRKTSCTERDTHILYNMNANLSQF